MSNEFPPQPPASASAPAPSPPEPTLTEAAALAARAAAAPAAAVVSHTQGLENTLHQVATELLRQRHNDRRWRNFFRLAWLALAAVVLWVLLSRAHVPASSGVPHTALVDLRGEISADSPASAETLLAALTSAFEDSGSQAVVLRINSPGGSPVQSGMVYDEIKRLKAKHNKKLYAVVEEVAASGAYYIAVAADEIYVDKASIVGSIGVVMDGFGFTGLMDKLGVERRLITAGTNKAMLDPFSPVNPEHLAKTRAMIAQVHQQFIAVVKEGRGERLKETADTFSGLFWNGEEAIKQGLADATGSLDSVARDVVKAPDIVDYTLHENVAERLAKRFGAAVGAGAVKALRDVAPLR